MTPLTPTPKGCGKIQYASRKDAEKAARSFTRRKHLPPNTDPLTPYHCRHCGELHIGRRPRGRSLTGVR